MSEVNIKNDDQGTIFLLGIGLAVVALLVLTTSVNIAALWVTRSKLDSVADATALAASHSIDIAHIYESGVTEPIRLNPEMAKQKSTIYLNKLGLASELKNLKVIDFSVVENTVQITLQADASLPFGYLLPGLSLNVTSSAKAAVKTS